MIAARWAVCAAALGALLLGACRSSGEPAETGIVVEVSSTLRIPADVDGLKVTLSRGGEAPFADRTRPLDQPDGLPTRILVVPTGEGDEVRPFSLAVTATKGSAPVVSHVVTLTFVRGRVLLLPVALAPECRGISCDEESTCHPGGGCGPRRVNVLALSSFTGGEPPRGSIDAPVAPRPPADGGARDAAAAPDGPGHAPDGPPPAGCATAACAAEATCALVAGAPRCTCAAGYRDPAGDGRRCEDVDECATNNGGCDPLSACTNTPGARVCGKCPLGYSGAGAEGCKDVDECATNNGGCDPTTKCVNTPGGHRCGDCPQGFTTQGGRCVDIDECATNKGGCDPLTTCTNTPGGRTCGACPAGYTGAGDKGCVDVDECAANNGGCHALTTCTNTPGGRTCGACPAGYAGSGASGCADVDECATNNGGCDALVKCNNTPGGFSCGNCPVGYTSQAGRCVDVDECATNNGGCHANATCTNTQGARTCACKPGFRGDGLTCVDATPPTVLSATPNATKGLARNVTIQVTFSKAMDAASTEAAFRATVGGAAVPGTFSWRTGNTVLVFTPSSLGYGNVVSYQVGAAAKDSTGNALGTAASFTFDVVRFDTKSVPGGTPYGAVRSLGQSNLVGMTIGDFEDMAPGLYSRSFVTFDLSGVPAGAKVLKAELRIHQATACTQATYGKLGNPVVDHVVVGSALDATDLTTTALSTETLTPPGPAAELKTAVVTNAVADDLANRAAAERANRSQFRFRFPTALSEDGARDVCNFYPPTSATPPSLNLEYEYP